MLILETIPNYTDHADIHTTWKIISSLTTLTALIIMIDYTDYVVMNGYYVVMKGYYSYYVHIQE